MLAQNAGTGRCKGDGDECGAERLTGHAYGRQYSRSTAAAFARYAAQQFTVVRRLEETKPKSAHDRAPDDVGARRVLGQKREQRQPGSVER